jgi:methionine-rich copper-binding protein CopC
MSPAVSSTTAVVPTQVVLTFNENIQDIGDAVVVTGPDGSRVDDGPPTILDTHATEKLHALVYAGRYTVTYRIVSADGHPVSRTLWFVLTSGKPSPTKAAQAQPAGPSSTSTPTAGGTGMWLAVGVAVVLAISIALVLASGRRRRARGGS